MHVILIFGERSLFLGKLRRSQKTASLGHKNDFFHQNYFFFLGFTPQTVVFFCKKTHSFWSSTAPRALCRKKTASRGSPPCTIFRHPRNREIQCSYVLYHHHHHQYNHDQHFHILPTATFLTFSGFDFDQCQTILILISIKNIAKCSVRLHRCTVIAQTSTDLLTCTSFECIHWQSSLSSSSAKFGQICQYCTQPASLGEPYISTQLCNISFLSGW